MHNAQISTMPFANAQPEDPGASVGAAHLQPAGAGGTQPGAGGSNNGLLVIEELDDDVQARVETFALPGQGAGPTSLTAAEAARRAAFADMLAPSNVPTSGARLQRTPSAPLCE